jgi:hypothetical protein
MARSVVLEKQTVKGQMESIIRTFHVIAMGEDRHEYRVSDHYIFLVPLECHSIYCNNDKEWNR